METLTDAVTAALEALGRRFPGREFWTVHCWSGTASRVRWCASRLGRPPLEADSAEGLAALLDREEGE